MLSSGGRIDSSFQGCITYKSHWHASVCVWVGRIIADGTVKKKYMKKKNIGGNEKPS